VPIDAFKSEGCSFTRAFVSPEMTAPKSFGIGPLLDRAKDKILGGESASMKLFARV
jgi:hypothetical protein